MRFSKNFELLPLLASLAAAGLSAHATAASNTSMASTGTTKTGEGLLWSDWYADPKGRPQGLVNGSLSLPGDWTPGTSLPKTGSATYSGNVVGKEVTRTSSSAVTGNVSLVAYFDVPRLAGTFTDLRRADGRGVGGGASTGVSWGVGFGQSLSTPKNTNTNDKAWGQMSVNGMTGEVQARFNRGISAVAGVWYLSKESYDAGLTTVSGTFAATGTAAVPAVAPAPAPAPKPPAPVLSGAFNSWVGTPKPGVAMPIKPLTPQGYSPSDTKQALYAGNVGATVINLRDNGAASQVGGEIKLAVNLDARSVRGEIGNFKGATDAANFLNAGTIRVSADLDRSRQTFNGSAVLTPGSNKDTGATGSFTGLLDTRSAAGSSVFVPGNLAQGSVGLASRDFQLSGSWRANLVPPPKR